MSGSIQSHIRLHGVCRYVQFHLCPFYNSRPHAFFVSTGCSYAIPRNDKIAPAVHLSCCTMTLADGSTAVGHTLKIKTDHPVTSPHPTRIMFVSPNSGRQSTCASKRNTMNQPIRALRALLFAYYYTFIAFCNFLFDLLVAATCR